MRQESSQRKDWGVREEKLRWAKGCIYGNILQEWFVRKCGASAWCPADYVTANWLEGTYWDCHSHAELVLYR